MGRKAFGKSKKQACDIHHCKKHKKESVSELQRTQSGVKHSRVDNRNI